MSKTSRQRISMLSRGGAPAGVFRADHVIEHESGFTFKRQN
jgi:hypothetical protein